MKLPWHNESEPIKHFNCRSISLPPGTKVKIFLNGILLSETVTGMNMNDDEKIDYYESKRILKLYGVENVNND